MMLARVRAFLTRTPVIVVLGLFAAYLLFAWLAFEPLVKWAAPKFIADKSAHQLELAEARFDPFAWSLRVRGLALSEADGQRLIAFEELFVDFSASSLMRRAWTFDQIRVLAPRARVALRADGSLNWSGLLEAFKSAETEPDAPLTRVLVRLFDLQRGAIELVDEKVAGGFDLILDPFSLSLRDISTLPDDKGVHSLAAVTPQGARMRWKGEFSLNPMRAEGAFELDELVLAKFWPYLAGRLAMAPPEGVAALAVAYRAGYADKQLSLNLHDLGLTLEGLALRGSAAQEAALQLDRLALSGGRFDLATRTLSVAEIALQGGRLNLRRGANGRLDIEDWFPPAAPAAAPPLAVASSEPAAPGPADAANAVPPWRLKLGRFNLDDIGIQVADAGFAAPLRAEIANLRLGFAAEAVLGAGAPQVGLRELGVDLSGLRLLSGNAPVPLLVVGGVALEGGELDLAARTARVARLALVNGKLDVVRDAGGEIALLRAFQPAARVAPATPTARSAADAADAAWGYRIDEIDLSGFQVAWRDASVQPAAVLALEHIEAGVREVSEDMRKPLPVKLAFRVKQGGSFQAEGKVVPASPSAEIKLRLANLALAPAQPYLASAANLRLVSGRASLQGVARYDAKAPAARQAGFTGGFVVNDLLLNESVGGDRFLAWTSLGTDSLRASPAGLDIDELRLDGLGAKLIIFQDKSTNLQHILKSAADEVVPDTDAPTRDDAQATLRHAVADAAPSARGADAATDAQPFGLAIDRIRVARGELDFADLSLSLPFGARIHDLKGAINGVGNQALAPAELELDGQVDEYGLARVVGQVKLFDPTEFMDLKLVFRNVEMNRLTPYTATFAGYKIDSGKLSLDLEYKIMQRQLRGDNRIVMDKLTLGEKIEDPNIKHLPLRLAIAILSDANGRIDLGLPVSGSLDDPQFSYAGILWKAVGNLLTKIVTAPFRALDALFGGGGEKLEQIVFEAGEARLTPPEREKFRQIAQILQNRPGLSLAIQGTWSEAIDRPAMREARLRRAVAEAMGLKLAPGEDPGPISTTNPRSRAALEALYVKRVGEARWTALHANWRKANPDKAPESGAGKLRSRLKGLIKPEQPLSAEELARLQGTDLHLLLYRHLLEHEVVDDQALRALAQARGEAVRQGAVAAGAAEQRVTLSKTAALRDEAREAREVPVKLELGVAPAAAQASVEAAPK